MEIEELIRQNTGMKRMSDTRAGEIQNIRYEIKSMENKNERVHQENKDIALTVISFSYPDQRPQRGKKKLIRRL